MHTLGLFLASSVVIATAAIFLAKSADVIAFRTGLGRVWAGSLLLAGATSLPELVTVVTAVRIEAPAIALGNIFGANMLNVSSQAILAVLLGTRSFYQHLDDKQVWVAVLAVVLLLVALAPALYYPGIEFLGFTPFSIVILVVYIVASWKITKRGKNPEADERLAEDINLLPSARWGWTVFLLTGAAILAAGPLLATSAQRIASQTGLGEGFIGVLGVSIVTTLPELVATAAAIRMGAADLAIGGMFGSNAFNVTMLAVSDPLTPGGLSAFAGMTAGTTAAGLCAVLLGCIGIYQLAVKPPAVGFSLTRPSAAGIFIIWVVGLYVVFRLGG